MNGSRMSDEARKPALPVPTQKRPLRDKGEDMPQYLVAGYLPDDFDPSQMDEATGRKIHAFNQEMEAAGVLKLACGLGAVKSLRAQTDGKVLVTDGPYLETKEHIGGLYILECADMDEAVAWARKGVAAARGQVEVREMFFMPGD
jgi:hypothetical protein